MPDDDWRPLSEREGRTKGYVTLQPGVPTWLRPSLRDWLRARFWRAAGLDRDQVRRLQTKSRLDIQWPDNASDTLDLMVELAGTHPEYFLDLLDALLSDGRESWEGVNELAEILRVGGSIYEVAYVNDVPRLQRRVDEAVADTARSTMSEDSRASAHLREAWQEAYGRHPSPSAAYREAVRAVEAAAQRVVEPNNKRATLGTMIGALASAKDRFEVVLTPAHGDPIDSVIEMMRVLWTSQLDRHGTADDSVPLTVSSDEAEAAVHLAATLVHWFQSSAMRRR